MRYVIHEITKEVKTILSDLKAGDFLNYYAALWSSIFLIAILAYFRENLFAGLLVLLFSIIPILFLTVLTKAIISIVTKELDGFDRDNRNNENAKREIKRQKFYWRAVHLEYKVNADAKVVNNYLLQNYTGISHYIKKDKETYFIDGIQTFDPERDQTFQYGFIAEGHKETARYGYTEEAGMKMTHDPLFEPVPEMFLITISQGQKETSILSFDTDNRHAHMFTTGLVRELRKAFKVDLV